ncbi:MAG: M48 family metallopeptidase [Sinimarinibacterium flocculans]|uniref:M48 family metallopeptidase n=1 Tax=Sinimarinibacterium flocculans TaxID=985250 RepID=UPI003C655338
MSRAGLRWTLLGLVLIAGPALAQLDVGKLFGAAKKAVDVVTTKSVDEEREIGRQWAATLLGAAPLVRDEALQQYVNRVGLWVALQSERPDLAWRFGVLDSPNVNAFATPGGYIFVTRGLLLRLRNEAELAGVLAHEIGHVVARHHLNAIRKAQGLSLGADLLSEFALKGRGDETVNERLLGGVREVLTRGLDKGDEYAADRIGVVLAARAGYDPFGLPSVLQTLQAMDAQDSTLALMFATHPRPDARLDALDKSMGTQLDGLGTLSQAEARFLALRGP